MKYILLAIALASTLGAQDQQKLDSLKLTNGKEYRSVVVTGKFPDGISITHESGTARIDFAALPDETRAALGYDAAAYGKAKQDAADAARRQQELAKQAASAVRVTGKISEIAAEGIYIEHWDPFAVSRGYIAPAVSSMGRIGGSGAETKAALETEKKPQAEGPKRPTKRLSGDFLLVGMPVTNQMVDGSKLDVDAVEEAPAKVDMGSGVRTLRKFRVIKAYPAKP